MKYIFQHINNLFIVSIFLLSCSPELKIDHLNQALNKSGTNRIELEKVLNHYSNDSLKTLAAEFLISNMPGHYSYKSDGIDDYYAIGEEIFKSSLTPVQQRDTLLKLSNGRFSYLKNDTIQDIKIITADYLINNIDQAFELWRTKPWLEHLYFTQFCEFVLPYKCYELQSLDYWRDTLQKQFGDALSGWIPNDDTYGSPYNAARAVRGRIARDVHPFGVQMGKGYSFGKADNMYKITYGECTDYVRLAICVMRALGLPVSYHVTPQWGRYYAGHDWYTVHNDKGELLSSEWDISSDIGAVFFPYQRIPKVFRNTYSINRETERYLCESVWKFPFSVFQKDVTAEFFTNTDISIPITVNRARLNDKYAYLAVFNACSTDWNVISYGYVKDDKGSTIKVRNGKIRTRTNKQYTSCFDQVGINVLYIILQYDEHGWFPLSHPFILHSNGDLEYINPDNDKLRSVTLKRKYYSNQNVVEMQRRLLGGQIQVSSSTDFSIDTHTLYTIKDLDYTDKIHLPNTDKTYRYARYLSANGTYGSIAELAFYCDTICLQGKHISSTVDSNITEHAFDGDYLSNFETNNPNDNWVGIDFGSKQRITHVHIVPRNDDNFVRVGDEYELFYWNNAQWVSKGIRVATDNFLKYDSVPAGALMWLSNYTRGMEERCFLIDDDGNIEWW